MEELHNDLVGVIVKHKSTAHISLMVVRLLEQEIVNNYMAKLFPEKSEEGVAGATTTPPLPRTKETPEEIIPPASEESNTPITKKPKNRTKKEKE